MDEEPARTKSDVAAKASTAPKQDPNTVFDDLDEDTRVLRGKGDGGIEDVVEAAREKLRLEAQDGARARSDTTESPTVRLDAHLEFATPLPAHGQPATPNPRSGAMEGAVAEFRAPPSADEIHPPAEARAPQPTVAGIGPTTFVVPHAARVPAPPAEAPTQDGAQDGASAHETRVLTPAELDAVGPVTERPSRVPPKALVTSAALQPSTALRRMDTLPTIRVAVLATDAPGEVRLIALQEGDHPPPGASLALLVPLTAGDGESVSRLLRGG
jgi:hypothetical protein